MKFSELRRMFRWQAELTEKVLNENPKNKEENEKLHAELFELNSGIRQILAKKEYLLLVEKDVLIGTINDGINTLHSNDKYLTNFYSSGIGGKMWLIFEGKPMNSKYAETAAIGPIYQAREKYVNLKYLLDYSQAEGNKARKVLSGLCPGIEDVLWNIVREKLNKERKSRINYLQNMIAQNHDKISEINRPNYVKTETEKLEKENIHWQSELSYLNATIDNIE